MNVSFDAPSSCDTFADKEIWIVNILSRSLRNSVFINSSKRSIYRDQNNATINCNRLDNYRCNLRLESWANISLHSTLKYWVIWRVWSIAKQIFELWRRNNFNFKQWKSTEKIDDLLHCRRLLMLCRCSHIINTTIIEQLNKKIWISANCEMEFLEK